MKLGGALLTGTAAYGKLKSLHPVVIEGGTGRRDARDPVEVARRVCEALRPRLSTSRESILLTQGDPLEARGISAVTRLVADELGLARGLVTLDASIDPDHAPNADRRGVVLEVKYGDLAASLPCLSRLEDAVDAAIADKNRAFAAAGARPLPAYARDYALLQEVTKAGARHACGALTLAHTAALADVPDSSITSFYEVGLSLELYAPADLVAYPAG